ncbi:MAG TPA: glycosyltransferase [Candidatus Dormibacteraeota bacterium]|nr:glycosyltransferase [Candidatus Dormibacteraeota bacterium]
MIYQAADYIFLTLAAAPFVYYLLVLFSTWQFFWRAADRLSGDSGFTPPVSNLKPLRGLDPEAYDNLASYCRQDYPDYEMIFCVGDESDPSVPILQKLKRDFPDRQIRILYGSGRTAINDKVGKLVRMVNEARHEILVINDSDVRVEPNYLRTVVAPLRNQKVRGVTALYVSARDKTFTQYLQSIGMMCDFFPGVLVARQLDGIKFAFGQTIVTTRSCLEAFGGYEAIENRPADDLLVGRSIAEQGFEVELLPYAVKTVPDYDSFKGLFVKRLRWLTVMRHMRPWGHIGLAFTQGLPWCLAALLLHPADGIGIAYFGAYAVFRLAITWMVGSWGLKQKGLWKKMPLIIVWDATAFVIWLLTFGRRRIRWRDVDYRIRDGMLVPVAPSPAPNLPR